MPNPYQNLDDQHFWKKAVAEANPEHIYPVSEKVFRLKNNDRLATAGSCFAQNVAKYLRTKGSVDFVESEPLRAEDPVFSGRYGNVYTARQLLQLFNEVMEGQADLNCAIQRHDGRYVDLFRPFMEPNGFDSADTVLAARQNHIKAIRSVFTSADTFVFTLGLTEAWASAENGKVYPVCPGIYSGDPSADYVFKNFGFAEVLADMETFLAKLKKVNPAVRVLLTVSPVPLTGTYSQNHILTATMHSKSILRAVCSTLIDAHAHVYYFPSYEMIANPYTTGSAYAENLRSVRPEVIERVMRFFDSEFLGGEKVGAVAATPVISGGEIYDDTICDDVEIENSVGF
jgi:GSCFA family